MGRGALSQAEGDGIAALMERLAALEAQIEALSAPGGARPVPHSSRKPPLALSPSLLETWMHPLSVAKLPSPRVKGVAVCL